MNKQPETHQDQKNKKPPLKLRDLVPQKDFKGGTLAPSTVPASLQEFLRRDSVPIKG